jgi:serine/threonine protein kinase
MGGAAGDALTFMHSQEPAILHRDIKPSNLSFTPSGLIAWSTWIMKIRPE